MKSIFKTLIEFAFGLHLNLDLKTKNRKGILLEKLLFFPFWPNLGTSPAASLPSLARSACSAGPARGPSSLPLSRSPLAPAQLAARSAQRCCPARLRLHSLAPARLGFTSAPAAQLVGRSTLAFAQMRPPSLLSFTAPLAPPVSRPSAGPIPFFFPFLFSPVCFLSSPVDLPSFPVAARRWRSRAWQATMPVWQAANQPRSPSFSLRTARL